MADFPALVSDDLPYAGSGEVSGECGGIGGRIKQRNAGRKYEK